MIDEWQNIPVIVKDVYSSTSILEPYFTNCDIVYCIADSIEENYRVMFNFTQWVNVVMKKGATENFHWDHHFNYLQFNSLDSIEAYGKGKTWYSLKYAKE